MAELMEDLHAEQECVAHVAVTRAKSKLFISSALQSGKVTQTES